MNFACFIEIMPTIIRSAEGIYAAYSDKHDTMLAARQRRTARFEYARNGHDMVLGYYCPNPIEDLVIGGVRRGRLLKSKSSKCNADFTYCFSETDELIGAEENIDGQIRQHYIIKESGYSWVLSYNDAPALYCMSVWDMQSGKVSFFAEIDTNNCYNSANLGELAAFKVWLFDYVNDSLPRFEWFTCDVYRQDAAQCYRSMGVKKYDGAICRHIYEYECKTEDGLSRYRIYKCWENSNDMIPDGSQDILV